MKMEIKDCTEGLDLSDFESGTNESFEDSSDLDNEILQEILAEEEERRKQAERAEEAANDQAVKS